MKSHRFNSSHILRRIPLILLLVACLIPISTSPTAQVAQVVEVVVEDPDLQPGYTTCSQTYWYPFSNDRGHTAYLTLNVKEPAPSINSAMWRPVIPQSGYYRVEAYIAGHDPINWCNTAQSLIKQDTTDAHYIIHHFYGTSTREVSQFPLSNQWLDLGEYFFQSGTDGYVSLTDLNGESNYSTTVSFSAVRFTFIQATRPIVYLPQINYSKPANTPPPNTGTIQAQGIDVCSLPSISKMQTWWDHSPYSFFGLYLGGIHFASFCGKADAAWVNSVHQQGWSFIPTWVGPQPPCTTFKHKISTDLLTAYQQGRDEADAASAAASAMGLTTYGWSGTVIYYDMESYSGASVECRQSAASFMNGWTERLHELGNSAGGYGTPCSSYLKDWTSIKNIPDVIWSAYWTRSAYDPNVSVFGLPCITDSLWSHHQRLRQYGGELSETWGGVTINIDINVADGLVAMPASTVTVNPTVTSTPPIEDTGWLSKEQGWLVSENHLYTTDDRGSSWEEISPAPVEIAYFLASGQAWALSMQDDIGSTLYHSPDRGMTWESYALTLPPDRWHPLQLYFSSPTLGWLVLQKETSQIFSTGLLLRTQDGGRSWEAYPLPAPGRINFISPTEAWLQDSRTGMMYHSTDGGLTWQLDKFSKNLLSQFNYPADMTVSGWQTDDLGWAVTNTGTCSGIKSSPDFTCRIENGLWETLDGGMQWKSVPLPSSTSLK